MGCCLSTKNTNPKPHNSSSFFKNHNPNTKSPPPPPPPPTNPLPEEETVVKEVLSETPISALPQNDPPKEHSSPNAKLHKNDVVSQEPKIVKLPPFEELSEEVSEICSTMSESCVSTATAATTETNNYADDDNDVTQIKNRSPAKYMNRQVSRDRLAGRPQKKRPDALPGRLRPQGSPGRVRPGPGRDGRGQNNTNNNGMRRGPVIGPERRSRSPVTRVDGTGSRSVLGRCPSGRRTGKSPSRAGPPESAEKNPKFEESNPKVENGGNSIEDAEAKLDPTNDESLENPHVSLECFIFL